jgi:putative flippase GtrA
MKPRRTLSQYFVFLTGSGLGAAIDYVLTLSFVYAFKIEIKTALALAMCISVLVVFYFHHRFTFDPSKETRVRAMLVRFVALAVIVYGLRALVLLLTQDLMPVSIQLALSFSAASLLNFTVSKMLIFKS